MHVQKREGPESPLLSGSEHLGRLPTLFPLVLYLAVLGVHGSLLVNNRGDQQLEFDADLPHKPIPLLKVLVVVGTLVIEEGVVSKPVSGLPLGRVCSCRSPILLLVCGVLWPPL